jgi:hypothetical protein
MRWDSTVRGALALLDRANSVMGGDYIGHHLVEARDRLGILRGLALPQPRRALDIGQKQRHGAGRQKPAHANFAPVHQRQVGYPHARCCAQGFELDVRARERLDLYRMHSPQKWDGE